MGGEVRGRKRRGRRGRRKGEEEEGRGEKGRRRGREEGERGRGRRRRVEIQLKLAFYITSVLTLLNATRDYGCRKSKMLTKKPEKA